jgi:hypothetical protein
MLCGSLSPKHGASSGCSRRNYIQLWRVAVNVLNKQLWTDDKGWYSRLGLGHGAKDPSP